MAALEKFSREEADELSALAETRASSIAAVAYDIRSNFWPIAPAIEVDKKQTTRLVTNMMLVTIPVSAKPECFLCASASAGVGLPCGRAE